METKSFMTKILQPIRYVEGRIQMYEHDLNFSVKVSSSGHGSGVIIIMFFIMEFVLDVRMRLVIDTN